MYLSHPSRRCHVVPRGNSRMDFRGIPFILTVYLGPVQRASRRHLTPLRHSPRGAESGTWTGRVEKNPHRRVDEYFSLARTVEQFFRRKGLTYGLEGILCSPLQRTKGRRPAPPGSTGAPGSGTAGQVDDLRRGSHARTGVTVLETTGDEERQKEGRGRALGSGEPSSLKCTGKVVPLNRLRRAHGISIPRTVHVYERHSVAYTEAKETQNEHR